MTNKISEIQIVPIKPKDGIVAFVSFVLNEAVYLSSVAVMTRPQGGYRLVYPTKKIGDRSIGIFYPIKKDFAGQIEKDVIEQLEKVMSLNDRHDSFDPKT